MLPRWIATLLSPDRATSRSRERCKRPVDRALTSFPDARNPDTSRKGDAVDLTASPFLLVSGLARQLLPAIVVAVAAATAAIVAAAACAVSTAAAAAVATTARVALASSAGWPVVLEAVATIDRAVFTWDEGDRGDTPAVGASRLVALAALGTRLAESAALSAATSGAAIRAATGVVGQVAAGVKLLLARGKGKCLPALAAGEDTVGVSCIVRHDG